MGGLVVVTGVLAGMALVSATVARAVEREVTAVDGARRRLGELAEAVHLLGEASAAARGPHPPGTASLAPPRHR